MVLELYQRVLARCRPARPNNNTNMNDESSIDTDALKRQIDELMVANRLRKGDWLRNLSQMMQFVAEISKPPKGVEIRFEGVTWSVHCNTCLRHKNPTVGSQLLGTLKTLTQGCDPPKSTNQVLKNMTGILKPGQMTLVLGRPGCGKTSFLKLLAQDLPLDKSHTLTGKITYNGAAASSGTFCVKRVVSYIDQVDNHLPTLTVAETLSFAFQMQDGFYVWRREGPDAPLVLIRKALNILEINFHVNLLLRLFGLEDVRDTPVGGKHVQGISPGQRKRVTISEKLIGMYRVLLGDQLSSGLDSATAFDVIRMLRQTTIKLEHTTVVSLLQPSPQVFALFDQLILLDEGQIIYMGPCTSVLAHFSRVGYTCPAAVDTADFLQQITSPEGRQFWAHPFGRNEVPLRTAGLAESYRASPMARAIVRELALPPPAADWRPEQQVIFLQPWLRNTKLLIGRQLNLTRRNTSLLRVQIGHALFMGLLNGSLFYKLDRDHYTNRYGLFFISMTVYAFGSLSSMPSLSEQRSVFYKHRQSNFFPTSSFVIAQVVAAIPVSIMQTVVYGTLIWWMCDMTSEIQGSKYGIFLLLSFCMSFGASQLMRAVIAIAPNNRSAIPMVCGVVALMMVLSGFIVQEKQIPPYWIWVYWLNPMSWILRAFVVLEFTSSKYDIQVPVGNCNNATLGQLYIEAYGFRTGENWVQSAIFFSIGFLVFCTMLTWWGFEYLRQGVVHEPPTYGAVSDYVSVEMVHPQMSPVIIRRPTPDDLGLDSQHLPMVNSVLPFTPVTLSFEDIWCTVNVNKYPKAKTLKKMDLLQGVSGYATPGSMTALMGGSGSGKTTLLDVISGRKNTGDIRGNILINGRKKNDSFVHLSAYVEQSDVHSPRTTVAEALMFSASLRLPSSVSKPTCMAFVDEVMQLLELDTLRSDIVGNPGEGGLSTQQRKRLTIGVELVANPSVLFLDEPTTGLDSRAAAIVMRVVRKIAATNRTVICTIHQPSEYLFNMFDRLLLLKQGGHTVYFGPIGERSRDLLAHLQTIPGTSAMYPGTNPATYMLEVIGAGISGVPSSSFLSEPSSSTVPQPIEPEPQSQPASQSQSELQPIQSVVDAAQVYADSELKAANEAKLRAIVLSAVNGSALQQPLCYQARGYSASLALQTKLLVVKAVRTYWRSPGYNLTRLMVSVLVVCVFGTVYRRSKIQSQADVIAHFSIIYVATTFMGVVNLTAVIDVMVIERTVFLRERACGMYSILPYALSFLLAEVPYMLFNTLSFAIVFYFIVGVEIAAGNFAHFWFFYLLITCTCTFAGQMLASLVPNSQSAIGLGMLIVNLWMASSGFLINPASIPDYWIWLHWMSPFHYLIEGLVVTEFHGMAEEISVVTSEGYKHMTVEEYCVRHFGGKYVYDHRTQDVIALIVFTIGFFLVRVLALQYLRPNDR